MRFHFKEVNHVPGKELYIADALSRMQADNPNTQATVPEEEINIYVDSILDSLPSCVEGWPDKFHLHDAIKHYWTVRGELSVVIGVLMKASRIMVPSTMRLQVLDKMHEGHQGIVKSRERAKTSVWWPGLSCEIQDMVENCKICAKYRQQRAEPLIPTPFPERPWQVIATDLFELDNLNYLIMVDYFSRFVEVAALKKTTQSHKVIRTIKGIFARHGIPEQVRSDNGPQYASAEFTHFATEWGFKHVTSSPRFPQSNGEVERAVKTTKSLLKKEKDPTKGLLAYRSTPLACGYSPSELLMGRKLRNTIPTFHTNLNPSWPNIEKLRERETESKEKQKLNFNQQHRVTTLKPFQHGIPVYIKDAKITGTVTGTAETPRSYIINTEKGTVRRNRSHLVSIPSDKPEPPFASIQRSPEAAQTPVKPTPVKPLPSPCISSRPKRHIRPSLKLRESLGLD